MNVTVPVGLAALEAVVIAAEIRTPWDPETLTLLADNVAVVAAAVTWKLTAVEVLAANTASPP